MRKATFIFAIMMLLSSTALAQETKQLNEVVILA